MTVCYNIYFVAISDITSILKETPDEDDLVHRLLGIEDNWYRIGESLQVHCNDLDHIKHSQDNNIARLRKVLKISLHVTWEKVITAIEGPIVKNKKKAMEICHHLKLGKLSLLSSEVVLLILPLLVNSIAQIFNIQNFIVYFRI